jgi:hypothetical protein
MSIFENMIHINQEARIIAMAEERINLRVEDLLKYNPFSIGEELVSNGWSHQDKTFIVDKVLITSDNNNRVMIPCRGEVPKYFSAEGFVKKKDGTHSVYRAHRSVKILEEK